MKTLFIATATTLLSVFAANAFASSWAHFNTNNSPLPAEHVTAICHTENGTWIGTDDGLAFYTQNNWTVYKSETSDLPNNRIYDIQQGLGGSIWVATQEGLLHITKNGWYTTTTSNSAIPLNHIRTVAVDAQGNPWIGTWGGGVASRINGQWTTYNTTNSGIGSNGIFTIEIDETGQIWVGSFNGGAAIFNGQDWVTYNTGNSQLPNNHVKSITFDVNGVVWLGTEAGLARKTANGNWNIYTFSNIGLSFNTVQDGVMESPGKLHFATDGGILQFDQSNFSFITFQNSNLPSNNTRCIALNSNNDLWVGTGYSGVNILQNQNTVGIRQPSKKEVSMTTYPNPVTQEITFMFPNQNAASSLQIRVVNMVGQTLITQTKSNFSGQQHQLNLGHLPTGTYQLIVRSKDGVSTRKFLRM